MPDVLLALALAFGELWVIMLAVGLCLRFVLNYIVE